MLVLAAGVSAQDAPTDSFINRDSPVTDSIGAVATFDLWHFSGQAGDVYRVVMTGQDGLAPLVGVRGASGDVFASSDKLADGTSLSTLPNGEAIVVFELPEAGEYVLIATRDGLEAGATVGNYTLTLILVDQATVSDELLPDEFPCAEMTFQTLLRIEMSDATEQGLIQLSAMTWDDQQSAVMIGGDACQPAAQDTVPVVLKLNEQAMLSTVGRVATAERTLELDQPAIRALIGVQQNSGQILLRLHGLTLDSVGDVDQLIIEFAPELAGSATLWVTTPVSASRLDPEILADVNLLELACPDVGLRFCADAALVASTVGVNGGAWLQPRLLDAAIRAQILPDSPLGLSIQAQNYGAVGAYDVVILLQPANP